MRQNLPDRFKADWTSYPVPYCCGAMEAGDFTLITVPEKIHRWGGDYYSNPNYRDAATTEEEAWKDALEDMREDAEQRPLMFNLVVGSEGTKALRKLLNEQTDAYHVHTWKNPNSGNILEMYVLTNGSKA